MPVVRHVFRNSLNTLEVEEICIGEIELALTEACTNVLKHVTGISDEYEVRVEFNREVCDMQIVDKGRGFDHESLMQRKASNTAEGGRGLILMREMVDDLRFVSEHESGTAVHLVKKLDLLPDSVLDRLGAEEEAAV